MTVKIEVWSADKATMTGPFPFPMLKIINALSGRKIWSDGAMKCKIEATPANLALLKSTDYQFEFVDKIGVMDEQQVIESMPTQHDTPPPVDTPYINGNVIPYDHQKKAVALSWEREWYALLFDVGLGKTAILIWTAALLWLSGKITGVLVLAPKGVHRQWVEEEIPKHLRKDIPRVATLWKKKKILDWHLKTKSYLAFFCMNTDAIRTKDGLASAMAFMKAHKGKVMFIVDESHDFKTQSSDRTRSLMELGELATYRRIATGTPITKNIIDAWAQFNFLDWRILGHKYLTSFMVRHVITISGGQIVGQKNTEEFYAKIAPHSFRLTKAEAIDLPPVIYVTREYEMSDETEKHYNSLKENLLAEMDNGSIIDAKNPAVALLRLHQVVCGHLPERDEEGKLIKMHRFGGERIKAMMEIVDQVSGPIVIWARFTDDRHVIIEALTKAKETFAVYEGNDDSRAGALRLFMSGKKRIFISNPRSGGVGLNLQGKCQTAIYFSNSFAALERWQSEGRLHRIGTLGAVTNFDIVARRSVDRAILRNLKAKKDLAELTLDDIRKAISES